MSSASAYGDPETRRRILAAAWDMILEEGPRVRLSDIADRAGVSRQSLYLHFGDRSGVLLALFPWMDEELGLGQLLERVQQAKTAVEALHRMVEAHAEYSPRIDAVVRVLEAHSVDDAAVQAALRERLNFRYEAHRAVIARLAQEKKLAKGWTIGTAADLFYAVTLPAPWRELTEGRDWTPAQYAKEVIRLLDRALLQ